MLLFAVLGQPGPFKGLWQRQKQDTSSDSIGGGGGGGTSWKGTVWEAGHRVPSMVSWPGHIRKGVISDALVSGNVLTLSAWSTFNFIGHTNSTIEFLFLTVPQPMLLVRQPDSKMRVIFTGT